MSLLRKNTLNFIKYLVVCKKNSTFAPKLNETIPTTKIMCNISKETILRANRRVSCPASTSKPSTRGNIVVSARYRGTTFSQSISMATIRANYGAALQHAK